MNHLEKVEKLRKRADVSYEEAKEALESCDWDVLDALILLEARGKVKKDGGETFRTNQQAQEEAEGALMVCDTNRQEERQTQNGFFAKLGRAIKYLVTKGCENSLVIQRHGQELFELPVIAFLILLILLFWVVLPAMIVSLFFDFSYHFRGAELGKEAINKTMDQAAEAVSNLKSEIHKDEKK